MHLKDVIRHELIGLNMEIHDAKNKTLVGKKGLIIDETKNMLKIKMKEGIKNIVKEQIVLDIHTKGGIIRVDGKLLVGRSEDRIKK